MALKQCVIYGDMSSDSTSDNYPTVLLCDDCIAEDAKRGEDQRIVGEPREVETSEDDSCVECGSEG